MFRDSRGVVHTVSAPDPLTDVPPAAASALAGSLLVPVEEDLGSALERCDAVLALLGRWQDAFFAALPPEVDVEEERRYAEAAGLDYAGLAADWEEDDDLEPFEAEDEEPYDPELDEPLFLSHTDDPATALLDEGLVSELERELLLLPVRTRLEALIGAELLVQEWVDLLADHEKCLGHLVLAHHQPAEPASHEQLVDRHALLHAGTAGHA